MTMEDVNTHSNSLPSQVDLCIALVDKKRRMTEHSVKIDRSFGICPGSNAHL